MSHTEVKALIKKHRSESGTCQNMIGGQYNLVEHIRYLQVLFFQHLATNSPLA